ncbi:MAG: YqeG family HAD IIIA-type phosphatase [Defluviitaleaceae bacterium]|nr:YqeG family HAD IIIA-type phosphatase [Defluviitaleaceae bacterium]
MSKFFKKHFFPSEMHDSVYEIEYDKFWMMGIRGLIFDIDNTLATFDVAKPSEKVLALLNNLTEKGFAIAFLSNNSENRVKIFCEGLPYPHLWKAKKPRRGGVNTILHALNLPNDKVVLIGDQIFTDCWVGNRTGIYTVLTKRIADRDEWQVKLKRIPEKIVMKSLRKYNAKN